MTVGRVYWYFDAMANHIRKTNPFGGGEDETVTTEPCKKCGEFKEHKLDCVNRNLPISQPRKNVDPGVRQHASGFDFGAKAAQSGLPVNPGIKVSTINAIRSSDPLLAEMLEEAQDTLPPLQEG